MLILTKHIGQLCNQIWSLLPIISYVEHMHSVVCVLNARSDYFCSFPALRKYRRILWVHLQKNESGRLWRKITRLIEKYVKPFEGALETNANARLRVINGWEHNHDKSFIGEQKQTIRKLFTPRREIQKKIKDNQ